MQQVSASGLLLAGTRKAISGVGGSAEEGSFGAATVAADDSSMTPAPDTLCYHLLPLDEAGNGFSAFQEVGYFEYALVPGE